MSNADPPGETEWSKSGQHTGLTDIPLTEDGVAAMKALSSEAVGFGKLIDPGTVKLALISPRQRAKTTAELLLAGKVPQNLITVSEDVREYEYGEYEGKTPKQIEAIRPGWRAFRDGCPGGETAEQFQARIDGVIQRCRDIHRGKLGNASVGDILIFSHGHFTRAIAARWVDLPLTVARDLASSAGSVTVLGYAHRSFDEPCLKALNLFGST